MTPSHSHTEYYFFCIHLKLNACVQCVGSLQSTVCCDRNFTCGKQTALKAWIVTAMFCSNVLYDAIVVGVHRVKCCVHLLVISNTRAKEVEQACSKSSTVYIHSYCSHPHLRMCSLPTTPTVVLWLLLRLTPTLCLGTCNPMTFYIKSNTCLLCMLAPETKSSGLCLYNARMMTYMCSFVGMCT